MITMATLLAANSAMIPTITKLDLNGRQAFVVSEFLIVIWTKFREDYCDRLVRCLTNSQYQEISSVLKQFLKLLNSGDYELSVPAHVIDTLLQSTVSNPRKLPWPAQLLCSLALHTLLTASPSSGTHLPQKHLEESLAMYFLPVMLLRGQNLPDLLPQLVRWVCTVGYACEVQSHSLSASVILARQEPQHFATEHVHILSVQLADWLKDAGLQQAPNPYSRSLFKKDNEQQPPVTECDGTVCRGFFTALCVGKYYTSEQILNIQSFSLLRQWLHATHLSNMQHDAKPSALNECRDSPVSIKTAHSWKRLGSGSVTSTDESFKRSDFASTPKLSSISNSPYIAANFSNIAAGSDSDSSSTSSMFVDSSSRPSPMSLSMCDDDSVSLCDSEIGQGDGSVQSVNREHILLNASLQYSIRIIRQSYRKAKVTVDQELQHACLLEAICVLDTICRCDSAYIRKSVDAIQRICTASKPNQPRVILAAIQFLIMHGNTSGADFQAQLTHFLESVVSSQYSRPDTAFETVIFLEDNLQFLQEKTDLLGQYLPNILKILAWDPRCFVGNFAKILPACITTSTAVEMLHSLLDLPCLTASLQLQKERAGSATPYCTVSNDPSFTPLFNFILRTKSGRGDTIDKLGSLHQVLEGYTSHPRVQVSSDTVPFLLRVYFRVIYTLNDTELCGRLLPVLMERCGLLYNIAKYREAVEKELSDAVVSMCQLQPCLVVNQHSEILEHLSAVKNMEGRQLFFTSLVWAVGEYLSPSLNQSCTPDLVSLMYEALETLAYELTGQTHSEKLNIASPRLVTSLMSTLAKLASRSQDLIPRAVLCIGRLGQLGDSISTQVSVILRDRSTELTNLLKQPNIAAMILSPPEEITSGRWHSDSTSLPFLLRTTASILQGQ